MKGMKKLIWDTPSSWLNTSIPLLIFATFAFVPDVLSHVSTPFLIVVQPTPEKETNTCLWINIIMTKWIRWSFWLSLPSSNNIHFKVKCTASLNNWFTHFLNTYILHDVRIVKFDSNFYPNYYKCFRWQNLENFFPPKWQTFKLSIATWVSHHLIILTGHFDQFIDNDHF